MRILQPRIYSSNHIGTPRCSHPIFIVANRISIAVPALVMRAMLAVKYILTIIAHFSHSINV